MSRGHHLQLTDRVTAEIDLIDRDGWSRQLGEFSNASIYQSWTYGEVRWGDSQLSHLVVKCDNAVISAAQLRIVRIPIFNIGIAYLPWGPMIRTLPGQSCQESTRLTLQALRAEYASRRGFLLRVIPRVEERASSEIKQSLMAEGYIESSIGDAYQTVQIDLTEKSGAWEAGMARRARRQLRRAEASDLRVEEGDDARHFATFETLYRELHSRKKFVERVDVREFAEIQRRIDSSSRPRIWVAFEGANAVASIVVSCIGATPIYLLGASNARGRMLRAAYKLHAVAIRSLAAEGFSIYDLGGVGSDPGDGTYRFKLGLVGRQEQPVRYLGHFDIAESQRAKWLSRCLDAGNAASRFLRALRESALRLSSSRSS